MDVPTAKTAALSASPTVGPALVAPRVDSEVARLRCVLLHRPGEELLAVAPDPGRMLFDAAVDVAQARAEHDAFAAVLRRRGVQVLYVEELLGAPVARALPNLMFLRDQSVWVGAGVVLGRMATRARAAETAVLRRVYEAVPALARAPRWSEVGPRVEGGDVVVAGGGRVIVGVGERTTRAGAERVATALLAAGAATEVLALPIPRGAGFHLDLLLTMVADATFAVWAPARAALRGVAFRRVGGGIARRAVDDPFAWVAPRARVIELPGADVARHGRRWDHGVNVLALEPGVVVAFADNVDANARLEAAGITVLPVAGAALAAGRGGPHCLACPLVRGGEPRFSAAGRPGRSCGR
jgi:arginine deiminase